MVRALPRPVRQATGQGVRPQPLEASKLTGTHIDAKRAAISFRDLAEVHWAAHSPGLAADTTRVGKRLRLDRHVLPSLGDYPVGAVRPGTVAAALGTWSRTLGPGTVGQVLRQVRQILDAAMADGLVAANAAKAVKAPTAPRRRDVRLSDDAAMAESMHKILPTVYPDRLREEKPR